MAAVAGLEGLELVEAGLEAEGLFQQGNAAGQALQVAGGAGRALARVKESPALGAMQLWGADKALKGVEGALDWGWEHLKHGLLGEPSADLPGGEENSGKMPSYTQSGGTKYSGRRVAPYTRSGSKCKPWNRYKYGPKRGQCKPKRYAQRKRYGGRRSYPQRGIPRQYGRRVAQNLPMAKRYRAVSQMAAGGGAYKRGRSNSTYRRGKIPRFY